MTTDKSRSIEMTTDILMKSIDDIVEIVNSKIDSLVLAKKEYEESIRNSEEFLQYQREIINSPEMEGARERIPEKLPAYAYNQACFDFKVSPDKTKIATAAYRSKFDIIRSIIQDEKAASLVYNIISGITSKHEWKYYQKKVLKKKA